MKKEIKKAAESAVNTAEKASVTVSLSDVLEVLKLLHTETVAVHRELEQFKNRMTR